MNDTFSAEEKQAMSELINSITDMLLALPTPTMAGNVMMNVCANIILHFEDPDEISVDELADQIKSTMRFKMEKGPFSEPH